MLKSKLATFTSALILAGSVFAGQQTICPNINDIKAEGLPMAEEIAPGMFLSYNISNYNMPSIWGFIIAPLEADSEEMALDEANEILANMSAPGIPAQENGAIICDYETGVPGVIAAAINDGAQITPMKLRSFVKKTL